jgi:TolB protein
VIPLHFPLSGSWQNPAFLRRADGLWLSVTRWVRGYNREPGEVYACPLAHPSKLILVAKGGDCCSQPGACWHATAGILFSAPWSGHDEIWTSTPGGKPFQITKRAGLMAYEGSWFPTGDKIAFESHILDDENNGRIAIASVYSGQISCLTASTRDCRQPNVSPDGVHIVWQEQEKEQWYLQIYDGKVERRLTHGGDETDATFAPDGKSIIYSTGSGLRTIEPDTGTSKPVAGSQFYMGAPSIADDGTIACECLVGNGDPDENGKPTGIVVFNAPVPIT